MNVWGLVSLVALMTSIIIFVMGSLYYRIDSKSDKPFTIMLVISVIIMLGSGVKAVYDHVNPEPIHQETKLWRS